MSKLVGVQQRGFPTGNLELSLQPVLILKCKPNPFDFEVESTGRTVDSRDLSRLIASYA